MFGTAATIGGAWWLHLARARSINCVPHSAGNPGFGVTANCLNQVGVEYVSFGVMMAGLFIIVLALLLLDRHRAGRYRAAHRDQRHIGTPGEDPALRRHYAVASSNSSEATPESPEDGPDSSPEDAPSSPLPEP
jgi:hypothetical protein